jgi:hypothetical protein
MGWKWIRSICHCRDNRRQDASIMRAVASSAQAYYKGLKFIGRYFSWTSRMQNRSYSFFSKLSSEVGRKVDRLSCEFKCNESKDNRR